MSQSSPTVSVAPPKRAGRWPGILGIIRFVFTGRWPAPREDDDSDHSRFADKLGRVLALPMFIVFSIGALLSVVQDPIQRNWNAYTSGHTVNATEVLAVFITLCLFGYGDITMVSAAGTLRDKIANSRPARERVFPSFLVFAIAILESVAFGGLIFLLEHPTTTAGWISLIGRSAMGPLCVIWFAVTPKRIPTQDEMDSRFIYRLAIAREEILRTINFKSVNNLMFLPVIEQLRLWLNKDWNKESEGRLNEFMEMLRRLTPAEGEAGYQDIQGLLALLEAQRELAEATANRFEGHVTEVNDRFADTTSRFAEWLDNAKREILREVQGLIVPMQEQLALAGASPDGSDVVQLNEVGAPGQRGRVHVSPEPPNIMPPPGDPQFVSLVQDALRRVKTSGKPVTTDNVLSALANMGYQAPERSVLEDALEALDQRASSRKPPKKR